ncbi:TransThyretin-Related family domain [Caenorhabditis elegans]|uniref:TransThyretin-Related family domain n=1 Tax=Caenorhabditis elegans TaxID=6239 RepID=O45683_CAEEL|nr:TransThyretin-Related family domain [Caenorhabditis elegans]CAB05782.3 TransThyretin-Related family domain [Caenorhabditis elegans]|eukprot:NP_497014.2 Uncharacterized protein CELE_K10H10.9 [Caenorhabditis elegans]
MMSFERSWQFVHSLVAYLILLISTTNCYPMFSEKVHIKCGGQPVAHAKVHIHDYKDGHFHQSIWDLHGITNEKGTYHFPSLESLNSLDFESARIMIKDTCVLKQTKCNLPYNQFEIPLHLFLTKHHHTLDLSLPEWESYTHSHCI